MTKTIIVTIRTSPDDEGSPKIKESVVVMTKTDHFKLPVEAIVLSEEEFLDREKEFATTGKSMGNSRVRNKLADSITMSKGKGVMAKFRQEMDEEDNINNGVGMGRQMDDMEEMDGFDNEINDGESENIPRGGR